MNLKKLKKKINLYIKIHTRRKIINVWQNETKNLGDLVCAPCLYYPKMQKNSICLDILNFKKKINLKNKVIIVGGGGLFLSYFNEAMKNIYELAKNNKLIIWGAGLDNYVNEKGISIPKIENVYKIGIRDYNQSEYPYLPCASCLSELFDVYLNVETKSMVKMYLHSDYSKQILIDLSELPLLENKNVENLNEVLRFFSDADVILTNSFHGAYWATLLNKKVIILPWIDKNGSVGFSEKFQSLKYLPVFCEDWKNYNKLISKTKNYPHALQECRDINNSFFESIKDIL